MIARRPGGLARRETTSAASTRSEVTSRPAHSICAGAGWVGTERPSGRPRRPAAGPEPSFARRSGRECHSRRAADNSALHQSPPGPPLGEGRKHRKAMPARPPVPPPPPEWTSRAKPRSASSWPSAARSIGQRLPATARMRYPFTQSPIETGCEGSRHHRREAARGRRTVSRRIRPALVAAGRVPALAHPIPLLLWLRHLLLPRGHAQLRLHGRRNPAHRLRRQSGKGARRDLPQHVGRHGGEHRGNAPRPRMGAQEPVDLPRVGRGQRLLAKDRLGVRGRGGRHRHRAGLASDTTGAALGPVVQPTTASGVAPSEVPSRSIRVIALRLTSSPGMAPPLPAAARLSYGV